MFARIAAIALAEAFFSCAETPDTAPIPFPFNGDLTEKFIMRRILIVEDNHDLRTILSTLVRQEGHEVQAASTAAEAITLIETCSIDIAVIDIGLPDFNGWELMRQIHQVNRNIIGVAMSALPKHVVGDKSSEAGFVKHLEKPGGLMNLAELIQTLGGN
jgi:CheY-like chemotaxis protein